jgi:hypothetical protein
MKQLIFLWMLIQICADGNCQNTPLFTSSDPVLLKAHSSIKAKKKKGNDSIYTSAKVLYQSTNGEWLPLTVSTKVRGNFRQATCFFPPLKIKIAKKESKNTLFEGNKNLKAVLPCLRTSDMNALIVKEYLCYKIYELVIPIHFNTRLLNLNLTDSSTKKNKGV